MNPLEIENEQLKKSLREVNDKYESLRDIDSMYNNNELLKQGNMNLLIKLKSFEELKVALDRNEIENAQLKNSLKEINPKYESLRNIDSPVKEVS